MNGNTTTRVLSMLKYFCCCFLLFLVATCLHILCVLFIVDTDVNTRNFVSFFSITLTSLVCGYCCAKLYPKPACYVPATSTSLFLLLFFSPALLFFNASSASPFLILAIYALLLQVGIGCFIEFSKPLPPIK